MYSLENDALKIVVNEDGAELYEITDKNNRNYLWNGDKKFWGRRSPVLFPVVGSFRNKTYTYDGTNYSMSQHGFARDSKFKLLSQTDSELWFSLTDNEQTLENYPFHFELQIGYRLIEAEIQVIWRVFNRDSKEMYYSLGAHPAFLCQMGDYISFHTDGPLTYHRIDEDGLYLPEEHAWNLTAQCEEITPDLFEEGVFIVENNQASKVSLCDTNHNQYLTVHFDAPLFGIWAPAKGAPFVCIEPWYGRCDASDYNGDLTHREWSNHIGPKEIFAASYSITIDSVQ